MQSQDKLSRIKRILPPRLVSTLDSLLRKIRGVEKDNIVERLSYYTTSMPSLVGSDHLERLYTEFLGLLDSNPKYALAFLLHSEGYYQGISIENELAVYDVWRNSVGTFDKVNEELLSYFISSSVRPIKTPIDELQKRKAKSYAVVAILEENLEWLNSLKPNVAGEITIQIGKVYGYVTDPAKISRLVRFYRNIEPLLRRIIHDKVGLDEIFRRDIDIARMYPYETLEDRCNTIERSARIG